MSQDWDFYFLRVDDKPAFILVDLGIANEAPIEAAPVMSYIRVYMQSPSPDGLSTDEEFDALKSIQDSLERHLTADGKTLHVGRATHDGCRDFFFYTGQKDGWEDRAGIAMKMFAGYTFECGARDDPGWETYFGYLYPSAIDRQRIANRRICEALKEHGDPLLEEREVHHWAYFPTADARASFIEEARKLGFRLCNTSDPEERNGQYGVQISRTDVPAEESVDEVTVVLLQLATDLGGEYDGWEASVCR